MRGNSLFSNTGRRKLDDKFSQKSCRKYTTSTVSDGRSGTISRMTSIAVSNVVPNPQSGDERNPLIECNQSGEKPLDSELPFFLKKFP